GDAHVHRIRPGAEPEHRRFVKQRQEALREKIANGGAHEAVMRSLIYVLGGAPATDERNFKRLRASRSELEPGIKLSEFKRLVREQFFILKLDREMALSSLPDLLAGQSNSEIDGHVKHLEHVFAASGELSEHAAERFTQIKALFDKARPAKTVATTTKPKAQARPKPPTKPKADKPAAKAPVASAEAEVTAKPVPKAVKAAAAKPKAAKPTAADKPETAKPAAAKLSTAKLTSVKSSTETNKKEPKSSTPGETDSKPMPTLTSLSENGKTPDKS
ncbi:unnamed protein product, partial [Ectocarpus sp. 12 AP-2014]